MIKIKLPGSKNAFIVRDLSNSKSIENEFSNAFYPYVLEVTTPIFDISRDVLIERNDKSVCVKCRNSEWKAVGSNELSLFECYKTIYSIIRENLQLEENYCFLHGAAMLIDDRLCLFLSETGMGKSTLSVNFAMQGCECLVDDLIILDKKNYVIYPISKYAHIRKESMVLFQNKTDLLMFNELINRYDFLLSEKRFQKKYRVEYIFILRRGHYNTELHLCDNSFECILENMFLPYQVKGNVFSAAKISFDYNIYNASYGDLDSLLKEIRAFINCQELHHK